MASTFWEQLRPDCVNLSFYKMNLSCSKIRRNKNLNKNQCQQNDYIQGIPNVIASQWKPDLIVYWGFSTRLAQIADKKMGEIIPKIFYIRKKILGYEAAKEYLV